MPNKDRRRARPISGTQALKGPKTGLCLLDVRKPGVSKTYIDSMDFQTRGLNGWAR
jgi:hypothetical protein